MAADTNSSKCRRNIEHTSNDFQVLISELQKLELEFQRETEKVQKLSLEIKQWVQKIETMYMKGEVEKKNPAIEFPPPTLERKCSCDSDDSLDPITIIVKVDEPVSLPENKIFRASSDVESCDSDD